MVQIDINQGQESGLGLDENVSLAVKEKQENIHQKHKKTRVPPDRTAGGPNQLIAIDALHEAIKEHGSMQIVDGKRNKAITVEQWELACTAKSLTTRQFTDSKNSLLAAKKINIRKPWVWVIWDDSDQNGSEF